MKRFLIPLATRLFVALLGGIVGNAAPAAAQELSSFRSLSVLSRPEPGNESSDAVEPRRREEPGEDEATGEPAEDKRDLPLSAFRPSEPNLEQSPAESWAPAKRLGGKGGIPGGDAPIGPSAFWSPAQNVRGGGDFALSGQAAKLGFPISMVEGHGAWIAIANITRLEISTSEILPQSGLAVPDELWSIQAGALHVRELGDGWTVGGMLMVGSASDEPFENGRDLTLTAVGFLNVPSYDRNEWRFGLFYSPTSQLPFPIPGVAYLWRPDERWDVSIGVPASVTFRPTERLTLQAAWRPLTNVDLTATQLLDDGWSLRGGYRTHTDTFFLSQRTNDDDRMFLFDQRLFVGVGRDIFPHARLEVSGAYLFDRRLFQAEDFTGSRSDGFGIEPGFLGTVQLSFVR
jgi:hypothetical protein